MSRVVILSGAGISAESGISTFRDTGGLWEEFDVKLVCNYDSLKNNEKQTIEFYDLRRKELSTKEANYAHSTIANLKKEHPDDIAIITQNVDDLFEKAGIEHKDVIHLHGYLTEVRCRNEQCNLTYDIGYKNIEDSYNGKCPTCHTKLRPNIVFFGEEAPIYDRLYEELFDCELLVVIGTSGNVINVDSLLRYVKKSILNNLEESPAIIDDLYSKVLYKPATQAIDEISKEIELLLMSPKASGKRFSNTGGWLC